MERGYYTIILMSIILWELGLDELRFNILEFYDLFYKNIIFDKYKLFNQICKIIKYLLYIVK